MATARKQVTTYMDAPTYEWLLSGAREQNRSVSQFLSMMLKRWAEGERSKAEEGVTDGR